MMSDINGIRYDKKIMRMNMYIIFIYKHKN